MASGTVILAALVATGAYVFHRDAPLLGSRPAVTEASSPEPAATQQQKIDARLWQDPFAAVGKSRDKLGKEDREQQCLKKPSDDRTCNSPLTEKDNETLVIGVTVSGAPYSEDAEHRRRTRYAVLAGLERAGFVPRDARHIGYFWWTQAPQTFALPALSALSRMLQIFQPWSDNNKLAATAITLRPLPLPLPPSVQLFQQWPDHNELAATATTLPTLELAGLLQLHEQRPDRNEVAATAATLPTLELARLLQLYQQWANRNEPTAIDPGQQSIVPYEWFDIPTGSQSAPQKSIIVLWLRASLCYG